MKVISATHHASLNELLRETKGIEIVAEVLYREGVIQTMEKHQPDVLVLTSDLPGETDFYEICYNARIYDIRVIFLAGDIDEGDPLLKRLVSLGVWDIIFNPVDNRMVESIFDPTPFSKIAHLLGKQPPASPSKKKRVVSRISPETEREPEKPVITAVWSPVSAGKTFISTQVSMLAAEEHSVTLVDLDLKNKAVSTWLNLPDEIENVYSLLSNIRVKGITRKNLTIYYAGLRVADKEVTPQPNWMDQLSSKIAIIDMPSMLEDWHKQVLSSVDHLLIVTDLDLHHCLRIQQEAVGLSYHLILNKDTDMVAPLDISSLIKKPLVRIPYYKKIYDDIALGEAPVFDPDLKGRINVILQEISLRKTGRPQKTAMEL